VASRIDDVHLFVRCLSVCLSPKCKKTRFSQKLSNLELWCLLKTCRKLWQRVTYKLAVLTHKVRTTATNKLYFPILCAIFQGYNAACYYGRFSIGCSLHYTLWCGGNGLKSWTFLWQTHDSAVRTGCPKAECTRCKFLALVKAIAETRDIVPSARSVNSALIALSWSPTDNKSCSCHIRLGVDNAATRQQSRQCHASSTSVASLAWNRFDGFLDQKQQPLSFPRSCWAD